MGDYTVGEQVWVNGVKPGAIAYLGETQFAPGQWAGVILNDLVGKNDGSVGGVRYFECQPLQGIFTRPSKLTRQPVGEGSDSHSTDSTQNQTQQGGSGAPTGQRVVVPLREGLLNSAVKTGNESGSNMSDSGSVKKAGDKDLRVGDRVLVSSPYYRMSRVVLTLPTGNSTTAACTVYGGMHQWTTSAQPCWVLSDRTVLPFSFRPGLFN